MPSSSTITPTAELQPGLDTPASLPAGVPFTVTLDALESFQIEAFGTGAIADLTGSEVLSDKPLAVLGAHQCVSAPELKPYCDTLVEMTPPVSTWGQTFVKAAYHYRRTGDLTRVIASVDATDVFVDGNLVATLDRGEFYERDSATQQFELIETTAPALAAMYEKGVDPYHRADPSYMILTPTEQWVNRAYAHTVPQRYLGVIGGFGSVVPALDGFAGNMILLARSADTDGFLLNPS